MNTGTVLKFAAPDGVTSIDGVTVTIKFHGNTEVTSNEDGKIVANELDYYQLAYADGYITLTAVYTAQAYPYHYPITITFNFPE